MSDVCTAEVTNTEELKAAMSTLAPDLVLVRKQTLEQLLSTNSGTSVAAEDLEFALLDLPDRQVELIRLLAKGLRNHEIANALGIATRTVKALLSALFIRYDVTNRTELLGLLMEEGHSLAMRPGVQTSP
jgi:DNA-binding NarL/FixJ family response regulator